MWNFIVGPLRIASKSLNIMNNDKQGFLRLQCENALKLI